MRIKIKIHSRSRSAYIPQILIDNGFTGDMDLYGAGTVLLIVQPTIDPEIIQQCLDIIMAEIKLQKAVQ